MNKSNLVEAVAKEAKLTKADATKVVNAVIESIKQGLARRERIILTNFGTFETADRAARKGFNPQKKEPMMIDARVAVTFKTSKKLKELVNGGVDVDDVEEIDETEVEETVA